MGRRYRRYNGYSYGAQRAAQHIAERHSLSRLMGGIDGDVAKIFLNLPKQKLEVILRKYGQLHGSSAASYARSTYGKWRRGAVKMSGMVAERLLNLVPLILEPADQFELVKKLRSTHLRKENHRLSCTPAECRQTIGPVVNEMVSKSSKFQLPQHIVDRVQWLANGDAVAAQKLLAAAEKEEARVRVRYLASEYQRIAYMLENMQGSSSVNHTIELPQGTVAVTISLRKGGIMGWLQRMLT